MGTVRDPAQLREMWTSWNDNVGSPMRAPYARMTEIANEGARELGFADTGAMWRSNYDMTPEEFEALTERLWQEVRPLYEQIHCFARAGLNRRYGDAGAARDRPDPRRSARQSLGAGMGQYLRRRRAAPRRGSRRPRPTT